MKMYLPTTVGVVASFTHMALVFGLTCDNYCAACWKTGSTGVDIKFSCVDSGITYDCGDKCPTGYENIHCAKWQRC